MALLLEPGLAELVGVDDQAARAGLAELDRQALAAAGIAVRLEPQGACAAARASRAERA